MDDRLLPVSSDGTEGARELCSVFSCKSTDVTIRSPPSWPLLNLITVGVRASIYGFEGPGTILSIVVGEII